MELNPAEIAVVVFVLACWLLSIKLFLIWWNKVHGTGRPIKPFMAKYKNANQIQVIEKPKESIIVKNYSSKHTKTKIAREKHLMRRNTMPSIVISDDILNEINNEEAKEKKRRKSLTRRPSFGRSLQTLVEKNTDDKGVEFTLDVNAKITGTSQQNRLNVASLELENVVGGDNENSENSTITPAITPKSSNTLKPPSTLKPPKPMLKKNLMRRNTMASINISEEILKEINMDGGKLNKMKFKSSLRTLHEDGKQEVPFTVSCKARIKGRSHKSQLNLDSLQLEEGGHGDDKTEAHFFIEAETK